MLLCFICFSITHNRGNDLQLTAEEERLILDRRAREAKQQEHYGRAIKLLKIAHEYAIHCREIGEYPSFSDFVNQYDGNPFCNSETYKKILQIIRFSDTI
jgi:hypothetical protein